MVPAPWLLLLCMTFVRTRGATLGRGKPSASSFKVGVGRFKINLNDNRLPDPQINMTLYNNLTILLDDVIGFWFDEYPYPLTEAEATPDLIAATRQWLGNDSYNLYAKNMLAMANQSLQQDAEFLLDNGCTGYLVDDPLQLDWPRCYSDEDLYDFFDGPIIIGNATSVDNYMNETFFDFASEYAQAVYNTSFATRFYNYAALMGLGWTVECSDQINDVLESKDEWSKAGSAGATTLMALLPTFLAFGNLYIPRSSEVFATSSLVGLGSSLYSFGLPVTSLSVVPNKQQLNLATFGLATLAMIASFAYINKTLRPEGDPESKHKGPRLEDLQKWSGEHEIAVSSMEEAKNTFAELKESATGSWTRRWHWWYLPSLFVTGAQAVMFALAVVPLLADLGAPRFIFACYTNWTGLYLATTAGINAIFRFCMWEVGSHERVLLYSLTDGIWLSDSDVEKPKPMDPQYPGARSPCSRAERELQSKIAATCTESGAKPTWHSMESELPPIYPPFLNLLHAPFDKKNHSLYEVHLEQPYLQDKKSWWAKLGVIVFRATKRTFWTNIYQAKYMWSSTVEFFKTGSWKQGDNGRRYRPLVALIHLSTAGRNFFITLMTGLVEALMLLFLTFFLASQWGGNLVITGFALLILVIFITAGRALGLIYVFLSTKVWGLHVINCDSQEEILGSLRIICSMKGVLVRVNGAFYYDGYRLNGLAGFEDWQEKYDAGVYDGPDPDQSILKPLGTRNGSSRNSFEMRSLEDIASYHSMPQAERDVEARIQNLTNRQLAEQKPASVTVSEF